MDTDPILGEENERGRQQSNIILPELQDLGKEFFEIVASGNVARVKIFLQSQPNFDINATNFQGVTALHIAVQDRNIQMVETLLAHPDIKPGDTHLHAIRDNQSKIAIMILDKLRDQQDISEIAGAENSPDFPDHTTPLAVAAQYGHFELISQLRKRFHNLKKPDPPGCNCQECKKQRETHDHLTLDRMRLFLYKAVSNPAYICQTANDPILEAFKLSKELNKAASYDREFYREYKTLAEEASAFATDLIDCARKAEEVDLVLKQTEGLASSAKFIYPRLLLALDYEQKTFVAHPHLQQVLEDKWIGNWYEWKIKSAVGMVFSVFVRIIQLPVIAVVVFFAPKSKLAERWQIPVNKFLSAQASYVVFLTFVYIEGNADKKTQLRGPPHTGLEWIIIAYVISYILAATHLCIMHGPKRFFNFPWNWYDVVMLCLFLLTFIFWIAAAVDVNVNGQRELERKYWHKYDPTLIAEGIYCMATIMAFLRLLFICQLNYHLGPLQLSLIKMIKDVFKFIILFSIIIFAYTGGLARLYNYYAGMVQTDDESKIKTQMADSFVDFTSTLKTLFWAIFCMSPIDSADVIIENLPGKSESETIINHHDFTEIIGYIAFATFHFIAVIVALNMLIACMSNTFTKVTDNVMVEWIFGRTEVYVDFMLTTAIPPPLNIISIFGDFHSIVEYLKALMKRSPNKKARWDMQHCCYIEDLEKDENEDFSTVMGQLVQRYFRRKNKEVEESDTEALRTEVMELRNALRDALAPS